MNGKQALVALLGVFLVGLSYWEYWRPEAKAVLFG